MRGRWTSGGWLLHYEMGRTINVVPETDAIF
jgi:hypothetical protein